MDKIKFTYQDQEALTDFEKIKAHIENTAEFLQSYPRQIKSVHLTEHKLIIVTSFERHSYENILGVWGNEVVLEI